jgi:hypothetical protein
MTETNISDEQKKDLTHVPQSLTFDTDALYRAYGEEATIIRDVIIYVANVQMKDLWGNVTLTIDSFCKELGYNRTTLQRTIDRFRDTSKKNLPIIDGHVFDSAFEYALFRAMKENITITRYKDNQEIIDVYPIIDRLTVDYDKTTKKITKRKYSIKLGDKILDNLFKEYYLIDFFEYKSLKSAKISSLGAFRNFYIFMARMISQVQWQRKKKEDESYIISVDDLCTILNSDAKLPKHKKLYVKRTLDTIQESLPHTKFIYRFTSNSVHGQAYYVSFRFSDDTIEYFNERLKAVFYKKLFGECEILYFHHSGVSHNAQEVKDFIKIYKNLDRKDFYNWLLDKTDIDKKTSKFKDVYAQVYHTSYPHNEIRFDCLPEL